MKRILQNHLLSGLALLLVLASGPSAFAASPSETAQPIMVSVTPDNPAYEIVGTITWAFDRGNAAPATPPAILRDERLLEYRNRRAGLR